MEQVVQKFEARSSNPEPPVRATEVGATSKASQCHERSNTAGNDRRTDDHVVPRLPYCPEVKREHCAILLSILLLLPDCQIGRLNLLAICIGQ